MQDEKSVLPTPPFPLHMQRISVFLSSISVMRTPLDAATPHQGGSSLSLSGQPWSRTIGRFPGFLYSEWVPWEDQGGRTCVRGHHLASWLRPSALLTRHSQVLESGPQFAISGYQPPEQLRSVRACLRAVLQRSHIGLPGPDEFLANIHEHLAGLPVPVSYTHLIQSTIDHGIFHAQHGEEHGPGYLVIDGPINNDGSAKLHAKGTVQAGKAGLVTQLKGNKYDYNIEAKFTDTTGEGTRDKGCLLYTSRCV